MGEQKINDLIFKELIKRGYSLEGKTRVWNIADSKLWYLTQAQAQAYLDLENSKNFKTAASDAEFELLNANLKEIKDKLGKSKMINVVDLGCGDGKKAAYVMEKLNGSKEIRYCPIDISGYMVRKAIETISHMKVKEIIETRWNISDFENLENITPLLIKGDFERSLFLLLGHTLGNFEIHDILYQIRSSMFSKDVLTIVSGIGNEKWEQWVQDVKDDKKIKYNSFFIHIPLQIGLGKDDVEFGARFQNSRIEYYYTLKKDVDVEFQNKKIRFFKGDQIIVAVSYKHEKDYLLSVLNIYFDDVMMKVSKDGSTFIAICRK